MRSPAKRVVVLGGGGVVRECFLPAMEALEVLDRVTVVDASPSVTGLAARYPTAKFVSADYRIWLAACSADDYFAAIIALPNVFHDDAVRLAFARGLDVLCEKPLTLSSGACRELAELAVSSGRVLAVNMVRRLYPSVALARYALSRGLVGGLQTVDIQHGSPYGWPAESLAPFRTENGGLLADMGVHYLDLAENLAGGLSPAWYEDDYRGGVEADLSFSLRSEAGVEIRLALSRIRTLANRVVLTGTAGTIEFAVGELARCTITDSAGSPIELTMPKPFTAGDLPVTFAACFAEQLYNFFGAVQRRERPVADGFDAARTAAHIEWAYSNRGLRAAPFGKTSKTIKQIEALTGPVVITGATGFIGTHLIEYLSARGFDQITALVRGPRNCANIARSPVQLETVDLLDYSQVRRAVRGMRYVFHLAYGRDGERRRETTIEGTRNVVKAAIDEACESVVVVSTAYVFGWPSRIVDESAPYRPTGGEYGRSKAEMERWCLRAASNSGRTRIVVLNPTCVYGPGGPTYSNLPVTLARSKGFCWINEGAGAANYTFVSNLVDAMLLGASNPDAHGERFIINDGTTTWRSFFSPILSPWLAGIPSYTRAELVRLEGAQRLGLFGAARLLARSPEARSIARKTSLGAAAANVCRRLRIATVGNELNRLSPRPVISGEQPPPPPRWLADLFPDHATRFSSEKAKRILGWTPRVDLETGQLRTIEHLVRIGLLPAPVEEFAVVH